MVKPFSAQAHRRQIKKSSKSGATKSALKQHKNKSAAKAATTTADPDGPGGPDGGPDGVMPRRPGVDDGTPDGPEAPETGTDTPAAKAKADRPLLPPIGPRRHRALGTIFHHRTQEAWNVTKIAPYAVGDR